VILAIDQGTSGTKALVVDDAGVVLSAAEVAVHPSYLPDGGVEQDPHELLESVLAAGRAALGGHTVDAIALANQGETVLAWDRGTGEPLSPAIVWQDGRAASICAELVDHGDRIAARTGLVLDPYFSAPKMAWLRRNVTTEGVVTTSDTWLLHQLTGEFVTDASTASRSLLLDLDRAAWDGELVALFGLAETDLPRIVACDEPIGATSAFGSATPVAGLIVDQQAALLAESCLRAGSAKCTFGTGAFLLTNTGASAPRSAAGLTTSVAWVLQGQPQFCLDGQVYTAASAVRWLADLGLIAAAADLDEVVAGATDDDEVLCVPALAGLAAPWWRADARATFTGLSLATGRAELVRSVLLGIAAQVAELADLVAADLVAADLGVPLDRLRVDGGLTNCTTLMQATADLLQVPVDVYPGTHATALGAAACARLAINPARSIEDAVIAWRPARTFEPSWSVDRAAVYRERWRGLIGAGLT
jgi:glycerol kinase